MLVESKSSCVSLLRNSQVIPLLPVRQQRILTSCNRCHNHLAQPQSPTFDCKCLGLKLINMGYVDIESVLKSKNLIYMSLTLLQQLQSSNLPVYTTSHDCHPSSRQNSLQPSCPNLLRAKTSVWNCYRFASRKVVLVIAITNLEIHVILLNCPLSTQVNFTN